MNTICPGCEKSIVEVDGINMTIGRQTCYNGKGDVCADGQLWCLDCLFEEKCPCISSDNKERDKHEVLLRNANESQSLGWIEMYKERNHG